MRLTSPIWVAFNAFLNFKSIFTPSWSILFFFQDRLYLWLTKIPIIVDLQSARLFLSEAVFSQQPEMRVAHRFDVGVVRPPRSGRWPPSTTDKILPSSYLLNHQRLLCRTTFPRTRSRGSKSLKRHCNFYFAQLLAQDEEMHHTLTHARWSAASWGDVAQLNITDIGTVKLCKIIPKKWFKLMIKRNSINSGFVLVD